jgi:hypothetical protein
MIWLTFERKRGVRILFATTSTLKIHTFDPIPLENPRHEEKEEEEYSLQDTPGALQVVITYWFEGYYYLL